jgi:hypothetical protein
MAVKQIGITTSGNKKEFQGLSTDPKPTKDVGSGSTFYELDKQKGYIYDSLNVNAITGNGWWEV